jgi:DNA-binding HxlR family transcriptional regulator
MALHKVVKAALVRSAVDKFIVRITLIIYSNYSLERFDEGDKMQARNYRQNCGVARASDLLGERWTLLIIRDLLIAPRRFSELEKRLKGMGTNLLSKRLKEMRAAGLVCCSDNDGLYSLTEMGCSLEPVILNLAKWSFKWVRAPAAPDGLHFPDWDLLALKALFIPDPKQKKPILAQFAHEDWVAWVRTDRTSYAYGLGEAENDPDIAFRCNIQNLRAPESVIEKLPFHQQADARKFVALFGVS